MKRSNKLSKIKNEIIKISKLKNKEQTQIKLALLISEALKLIGINPILVGGAAVAFYSNNQYTTHDIDMIVPFNKELNALMKEIGFDKLGKDFVNKDLNLYVEFPSSSLGPTEIYDKLIINGIELLIISIEDLIVDRLCAFKFWKSQIDGINALILLEIGRDDTARTEERARQEDVLDALDYLISVQKKIIRKKLSKDEASELIQKYSQNKKIKKA
ncbi:MAG: DUF6036 family nucleotidyltransferase [Pseudomonadota bacterium]